MRISTIVASVISHLAAFSLAAAAAALCGGVFIQAGWFLKVSLAVAAGHVVLLAAPAYLVLRYDCGRPPRAWEAVVAGFLIGAPIGSVSLLSFNSLALLAPVASGIAGAIGGLVFWAVLAASAWAASMEVRSGPTGRWARWLSVQLLLMTAAVAPVSIALIPPPPTDRSCHNPLRDGRKSIGSQINASLQIEPNEWPALKSIFLRFTARRGWSVKMDIRGEPDSADSLHISACEEGGVQIMAQQMILPRQRPDRFNEAVQIMVFEPDGQQRWRAPMAELVTALMHRWPGRVRFRDEQGQSIDPPPFIAELGAPGLEDLKTTAPAPQPSRSSE